MKQHKWRSELRFDVLQFAAFFGWLMFVVSGVGLLATINFASVLSCVILASFFAFCI